MKEEWQKFWKVTLAKEQKERDPACYEAILLLMCLTNEVLERLMVFENRLRACTNKPQEGGVWCSFHSLKRGFYFW